MKYLTFICLLLTISLYSCNRSSVTAQKVGGTWKLESHTINGTEQVGFSVESAEFMFEECDVAGDWCPMSYTETNSGKPFLNDWTYKVSKNGKELYIMDHIGNDTIIWDIDKLKGDVFKLSFVDDFDKDVHKLSLKR